MKQTDRLVPPVRGMYFEASILRRRKALVISKVLWRTTMSVLSARSAPLHPQRYLSLNLQSAE